MADHSGYRFLVRCAAVPTILLLVATVRSEATAAQGPEHGALTIEVSDPDGRRLSGVTVIVAGPQNERTLVSDSMGIAVLRGLVPGLYSVAARGTGFRDIQQTDIVVSTGRTTRVRFALELAGVEEIITVQEASPLIDPGAVHMGATVSADLVNLTPSGAGIFNAVLDKVPGVILSGVDVGGGNATQQQAFSAHGSLQGQNQFFLDGSPTTDASNGSSGMFYPVQAFAEVAVSTAAHDVALQTPGVIVSMVTKSGTNRLRGAARFYYSDESLAGDNVDARLREQGVASGNPNTLVSDLSVQVGGPLLRDRLWGFVDYSRFDEHRLILGLPEEDQDERNLRNLSTKLDWQVNDDHRVSAKYFFGSKFRLNANASRSVPPASSILQDPTDSHVGQLNWAGSWGDGTSSDVRFSYRDTVFGWVGRGPDSPAPHPDYPGGIPYTLDFFAGDFSGAPTETRIWAQDYGVSADLNRAFDSGGLLHDIRLGGRWRDTRRSRVDVDTQSTFQWFAGGTPEFVSLLTSPAGGLESASRHDGPAEGTRELSLYVQDTAQIGRRWTVNAGLRYDYSRLWIPEQTRPDSYWAGVIPDDQFGAEFRAATFAVQEVKTWHAFTPRISASYDPSGRGRTFLKGAYAEYTLQPNSRLARTINPLSVGVNEYQWTDLNGDGVFQWGEHGALTWSSHPSIDTAIDPELRAARTREITLGIEHQPARDIVVGATAIYRNMSNGIDDINVGVPYGPIAERLGVDSAYTPVDTIDPGPDGILGTPDDGGTITVWSQDPSTFGQNSFLITNPQAWGFDAGYRYRGLEFVAQKRFAGRWQALASWSIGRTESDFGGGSGINIAAVFDNPNADVNRQGRTPEDRTHVVKLNASYLFADPVGVNIGTSLRYESGPPVRRAFRLARGTVNQGRPSIVAAPYGEDDNPASLSGHMSSIAILDMRADKQFALPSRWGRLTLVIEAFNLLNENAERSVSQFSGPNYGRISSIVPPRMLRLGLGWAF